MSDKIQIRNLIASVHKAYQMFLKEHLPPLGLNPGWVPFLLHLGELDGVSQESLAKAVDLDPGTTARALFRMEKEGLVIRKPDTTDRRVLRVTLTRKGREAVAPLTELENRWEERLLMTLPARDEQTVKRSLEKMATARSEQVTPPSDERINDAEMRAIEPQPDSEPAGADTEFPMDDFFS